MSLTLIQRLLYPNQKTFVSYNRAIQNDREKNAG